MKRFNVLFSFLLLAGLTCFDNLFASKKRKRTSFDVQQPGKEQKVSSDEKEKFSPSRPSNNIFSKIFNQQLTGKRPSINLDAKDEKGNTKLHNASLNGRVSEAELLIRAGAKFDFKNECGKTPLDLAIENKQIATKHLLQQYKALFEGTQDEDLEDLEAAIAAGAYVDAKDGAGYTPLHRAAYMGNLELVQLLMQYNVDKTIHNEDNHTALDLAEWNARTIRDDVMSRYEARKKMKLTQIVQFLN